jgi:two-component system, cell cycle sensor histidine kinase and response regulator CckA
MSPARMSEELESLRLRLSESEQRLRFALEAAELGLWDYEVATGAVALDERTATLLGHPHETGAPRPRSWEELVHPDDWPGVREELREYVAGRRPRYQTEYRLRHRSGTWMWVLAKGQVIARDSDGRPQRMCGAHLSISDPQRTQAALEQTHLLLEALLEQSPVPTAVASAPDLVVRYANGAAMEFLGVLGEPSYIGLTLAEVRQRQTWRDLRADGTPIDLLELPLARALRGVVTQSEEYRVVRKDGTEGWELVSGTPIYDRSGALVAGLIVFPDITERKRAEAERARLTAILESTSDLVATATPGGRLTYLNTAGRRMLGWTESEDPSAHGIWEAHPAWAAQLVAQEGIPTASTQGVWHGETALLSRDGRALPVLQAIMAHRAPNGDLQYLSTIMRDISERKQGEAALRAREQLLDNIIEQNPYPMWISDAQGTLIRINQACCRVLHIREEEVVGKYNVLQDNVVREQGYLPLVQSVFRAGETVHFVLDYDTSRLQPIRPAEAAHVILEVTISPVKDEEGAITNAVVVHQDITERKRAEETVAAAAREWQTTFDAVNDVIWMLDRESRIVRCNAATAVHFGKDPGQILGRHCWEVVHGTPGPIPDCPVLRMAQSKHRESMELRLGAGWCSIDVDPILDATGALMGAVHIVSDITERKRAEEAIRHYAQRLEKLRDIERATLADEPPERIIHEALQYLLTLVPGQRASVLTFDLDARAGTLLDAVSDVNGLLAPGMQVPVSDFADAAAMAALAARQPRLVPDLSAMERRTRIDQGLHEQGFRTLLNIPLHTGREFIGTLNVVSRTANAFTPVHIDIATEVATTLSLLVRQVRLHRERASAEDALRASEAKYRTLFERSADGMLLIDGDRFVDCNDAAASILHYPSRAELMDRHPWEISPAFQPDGTSSRDLARTLLERAVNESSLRFEWDHATADGTIVPVEVVLTAVPAGERELLHVSWRDITARRRAEEEKEKLAAQLRQSQKMEAIGQLAGGVAHDFNNILTAIFGHVELAISDLQARLPDARSTLDGMQEIQRSAQRASALTRQLLTFSRRQIMRPAVLDLNATLRDLEKMLQRLIRESIVLELALAPDLPAVEVDPGQIEQVIVNLVVNARDAMPDGGKLTLHTSVAVLDAAYAAGHPEARPGEYTLLTVSDTGCGMNAATLERIFEPFFTTKPHGEGTGLGLPTVYGIVKQAGGHLVVYSEPAHGTVFRIYLPSVRKALTPIPHRRSEPAPPVGTETILLCEDDAAVRELAAHLLAGAGYRVLAAPDAGHALQAASQQHGLIHLLLTDVIMPGMNGRKLADILRARRPDLKTLFMSGYTSNVIAHHGVLEADVEFLEKPFSRQSLLQRVREVLDKPALTGETR